MNDSDKSTIFIGVATISTLFILLSLAAFNYSIEESIDNWVSSMEQRNEPKKEIEND